MVMAISSVAGPRLSAPLVCYYPIRKCLGIAVGGGARTGRPTNTWLRYRYNVYVRLRFTLNLA